MNLRVSSTALSSGWSYSVWRWRGGEGYVFPVMGWVAVALVIVILLGGVGLGVYIRGRYSDVMY